MIWIWIDTSSNIQVSTADGHRALSVVVIYSSSIWKNVDVCALRPELAIALSCPSALCHDLPDPATYLCKVLANIIRRVRQVVTEWTRLPSLARALAEELARYMLRIWPRSAPLHDIARTQRRALTLLPRRTPRPIEARSSSHHAGTLQLSGHAALRPEAAGNVQAAAAHVSVVARHTVAGCAAIAQLRRRTGIHHVAR